MRSPRVIVIGAGPAGSTAARRLAEEGVRVTLLEARRLPRDKTCAGGVTPKARQWVPEGVLEDAGFSVHKYEFRGGRLPPFRLDEPDAEISMVLRASFDYALAEAAASAGCDVLDGEPAEHIVEQEHRVEVRTRRSALVADYVVGADGYPSRVAHELGLGQALSRRSLAISGHVPLSPALPADRAVISFSVARGYAWYFPKGDHASVGIGAHLGTDATRESVDVLRNSLESFAANAGFGLDHVRLTGHWVPHGIRRAPIVSRRGLLVGDAAGMTDPLLGEGIAYAIGSGRLAAEALLDVVAGRTTDLTPYERRLRSTYGRAMRRLGFAARVVEHSPTIALAAARFSPWIRAYGVNVVSGLRAPFTFDQSESAQPASSLKTIT